MEAIDRLPTGQRAVHHPARHRGLRGRGGVHAARHHRREPARAAAPCARSYSPGDRRGDRGAASCRDGAPSRRARRGSDATVAHCLAAWARCTCRWMQIGPTLVDPRDGGIVVRLYGWRGAWHHAKQDPRRHQPRCPRPAAAAEPPCDPADCPAQRQQSESSAARGGLEPHVRPGRIEEPVHPLARHCRDGAVPTAGRCAFGGRRAFRSIGLPCAPIWPGQRAAARQRSAAAAVRRGVGEPELPDPPRRPARRAAPAAARRASGRCLRHGARVPHPEPAARRAAVRAARAVPGCRCERHRRAVPDHRVSAGPGDPRAHPARTGRPSGGRSPACRRCCSRRWRRSTRWTPPRSGWTISGGRRVSSRAR